MNKKIRKLTLVIRQGLLSVYISKLKKKQSVLRVTKRFVYATDMLCGTEQKDNINYLILFLLLVTILTKSLFTLMC